MAGGGAPLEAVATNFHDLAAVAPLCSGPDKPTAWKTPAPGGGERPWTGHPRWGQVPTTELVNSGPVRSSGRCCAGIAALGPHAESAKTPTTNTTMTAGRTALLLLNAATVDVGGALPRRPFKNSSEGP
jgi:hypothetical protein